MADRNRTMRLSHTLSPFGPGAIYDYLGESLLVVGNDRWPIGATRRLGRADMLEQKYGKELRLAPLMPEGEGQFIRHNYGLPVYRFPAWLFCPMCHRMIRWKHREYESGGVPACPSCRKGELVPIPIDPLIMKSYEELKRFNVIFPASLLTRVDQYRKEKGLKRSTLIRKATEAYLLKGTE